MGIKSYSIDQVFSKRPKVLHYNSLSPEVRELVDYTVKESLKPNPVLRVTAMIRTKMIKAKSESFWNLTWNDLVLVREAVKENEMADVFRILYGIDEKQFLKLDMFNAFSVYKWVTNNLMEMAEIEVQELGGDVDPEMKEAGADQLIEFGYMAAVDSIANGDILKHKEILSKPYAVIFRKMCLDKLNNQIRKTYQENVSRKNQRNNRG